MADCAILAVASTTQTVRALLERLVKDVVLDDHAASVPWTIVNKYYTAEVHFLVHTLSSWASLQDHVLTPALLFVWNRGEPYRDHVRELSRLASKHEFEVTLAVRLSCTGSASPEDEDEDVDAYLSSKGFEFVDVPDDEAPLSDRSGIPGIPRIIDALSTIMWPSMVRQTSDRLTTTGFIGTAQVNPGISSNDYHNLVRLVGERISGNKGDHMQRELEELERWLDEDTLSSSADASVDDETVPWSTAVTPGTLSPSSSGFLEFSRPTTPKAGFEDDFTSFVSAPSPGSAGIPPPPMESLSSPGRPPPLASMSFSPTFSFKSASSGRSTPTFDDSFDTTRPSPGESYRSLGSVSDFEDPGKDAINLEWLPDGGAEADEDMPSRLEIAETSRRIFGTIPLSLSPVQERGDGNVQALPAPGGMPPRDNLDQDLDVEMTDDLERFDLQNVLGALQGLKEEIAGMPDKERRRAAARVALGLAYGLGGDPHSEASEELV